MTRWCRLRATVTLLLQLVSLGAFAAEPLFYLRDLGPGVARGLNDRGEIVGNFGGVGGGVWSAEVGFTALRPPDGVTPSSAPLDINNAGQIAGTWFDPTGFPYVQFWPSRHASPLPVLGQANLTALNGNGVVVGYAGNPSFHSSWRWQDGALDFLPGLTTRPPGHHAFGINDAGVIVGEASWQDANFDLHAVVWSNGAIKDIGTLPDRSASRANAINNFGVVVGTSENPSEEAFTWTPESGLTSIGPGVASRINDRNWVIGHAAGQPFVWRPGEGRADVGSLVALAGTGIAELEQLSDINARGQIVGAGLGVDGLTHAVLLTPVPEPEVWLLAALGALFTIALQKRSPVRQLC